MSSQCQVMSFECYDLLIQLTKCMKFMITYILQYEIPFRMQFPNLGHDLLFLSYDLIDIISYHMHLQLVDE